MQPFSFSQIDAKHHLYVPCFLHLRSLWNLWNSLVTLRNLFCLWGNWSHGAQACGCSESLISKLSFLLGRSDTFVEDKGVLPRIGLTHKETSSATKDLPQSSGSTIFKSHEGVINNNYSVPSQGLKTVNFHPPQPESVLNISTLGQRCRGETSGKTASEMLGDTVKQWRWNRRKWKGNRQDCWGQVKRGWPPLRTFWGVISNESRVSTSCSYLLAFRSWAVSTMSLISISSLAKWEWGYSLWSIFSRIKWKINEEPSAVAIIMCTIT